MRQDRKIVRDKHDKNYNFISNILKILKVNISIWLIIMICALFNLVILRIRIKHISIWPGLDLFPSLIKYLSTDRLLLNQDLFSNSEIYHSGRGPFIILSGIICKFLKLTPETYFITTSIIIQSFGPILLLLAIISAGYKGKCQLTFFHLLGLMSVLTLMSKYEHILFIAGYDSSFFNNGMTAQNLSIILTSTGILLNVFLINSKKIIMLTLLVIAIILHPSVSICLILLYLLFKIANKNLKKTEILVFLFSISISLIFEFTLLMGKSSSLNGQEFTEIFAQLRHPQHFWPSFFISRMFFMQLALLSFFIVIVGVIFKNWIQLRILFFINIFIFSCLTVQFLLVEKLSVLSVSQFGITRGLLFIGFSFGAIIFNYLESGFEMATKINPSFGIRVNSRISIVVGVTLLLFSVIVVKESMNVAKLDFIKLQSGAQGQLSMLRLPKNSYVLVDPSFVNTQGWREYGGISVYLDDYFPFNMNDIQIYRNRWVGLCSHRILTECDISMNVRDIYNFMLTQKIDYLVTVNKTIVNEKYLSNFEKIGQYANLVSFKIIK